jgi:hypothetical protein
LSRAWADSIGPPAGHFPVGLVHEPPVAGGAASGPGGDDELLDEDLDQPVDAHGIDVDATRGEQFLDVEESVFLGARPSA